MLAAILFSGLVLEGHVELAEMLIAGLVLVGHFVIWASSAFGSGMFLALNILARVCQKMRKVKRLLFRWFLGKMNSRFLRLGPWRSAAVYQASTELRPPSQGPKNETKPPAAPYEQRPKCDTPQDEHSEDADPGIASPSVLGIIAL